MTVWLTMADHYCAGDRRGVVHAVSSTDYARARRARREGRSRRQTYDAVCGKRLVRLRGHTAVVGGEHGTIIAVWPPPVAWLAEDGEERCRDCWERTGKRRPHPSWKNVERVAA